MNRRSPIKLLVRFLFSVLAFALSFSLIVVVAVTQANGVAEKFWRMVLEKSTDRITNASKTYCALNHEAVGVCTYAYFLGGVGIIIAIISFWCTFVTIMANIETPIVIQGGINLLAFIWWFVGSIVLCVFGSRVNILSSRRHRASPSWVSKMHRNDNIARTSILLITVICTIM